MGIYAVYPKPNLSKSNKEHKKCPYLLRDKLIFLPNQVWAIDITYIVYKTSHMYLTAVIDWFSRYMRLLAENNISQSMDGKAGWVDNVIIERWFRSLKCENIYITEYGSPRELRRDIDDYINDYNYQLS